MPTDDELWREAMRTFRRPDRAAQGRPLWELFGPDDDWHPDPELVEALHQSDYRDEERRS